MRVSGGGSTRFHVWVVASAAVGFSLFFLWLEGRVNLTLPWLALLAPPLSLLGIAVTWENRVAQNGMAPPAGRRTRWKVIDSFYIVAALLLVVMVLVRGVVIYQQTSSDNRPESEVVLDGKDPQGGKSHHNEKGNPSTKCADPPDAATVQGTEADLESPDQKVTIGHIEIRKSALTNNCRFMVWPHVLFDKGRAVPAGWTLYVESSRPATRTHLNYSIDHKSHRKELWGNMLSTERGCVRVEIYFERDDGREQSKHAVAHTPCHGIGLDLFNIGK